MPNLAAKESYIEAAKTQAARIRAGKKQLRRAKSAKRCCKTAPSRCCGRRSPSSSSVSIKRTVGCPDLDSLVLPNRVGTYMDWRRVRYRALYLAGLSDAPAATAKGAFDPYLCRHIGAVATTHAERPAEIGGGIYSRYEVARHLGHTVST
jgi:hypothetical protein